MNWLRFITVVGCVLFCSQCALTDNSSSGGIFGGKKKLRRAAQAADHESGGLSFSNSSHSHLDDTARFLAGMDGGRGSALNDARKTGAWKSHQSNMDRMFNAFASTRQRAILGWQATELAGARSNTVFYPFGGPDFLYANAFFPGASKYVLVGLEPVGSVPTTADLQSGNLSNLSKSVSSATSYSYFITKDMRVDLAASKVRGTTPILMAFMARTGHRIQSVNPISSPAKGVHIVGSGPNGTKHVYYLQKDISNGGGGGSSLSGLVGGSPVTFLKSASYLMHSGGFSQIRNMILSKSRAVVQDPSGIPFSNFESGWNVRLYGNYSGTLDIFKQHYQGNLASAYKSGYRVKPMPFGVGYKQTSVVVATK